MSAKLLLCDCAGTFAPDREALEKATGLTCSRVYSGLCVSQPRFSMHALNVSSSTIEAR